MTDKDRREEATAALLDDLSQFASRKGEVPAVETMVGPEEKMWLWGMAR